MKNRVIILQLLLLCTIFIVPGFISCTLSVPDLSEYQGIDYIENYKFHSIVSGFDGNWAFDDDIVAPNGYHYIGFNSNESGADVIPTGISTAGLPGNATGDISRLEIFNLVNDGGFENPTGWNVGWSAGGGATISRDIATYNSAAIPPNHSLDYSFTGGVDNSISFNMGSAKDTFLFSKRYIIRFNFFKELSDKRTPFRFNTTSWWPNSGIGWDYGYTKFPDAYADGSEVTANSPGNNQFYILYDYDNIKGYIDDFRVVRSDIDYYLKLTVPYSGEGRPNLFSGTYRFTVWFKEEDPGDVSPSENRFPSSRVSLGIGRTPGTATVNGFDAPSQLTPGAWRRLSVERFFQITPGDSLVLLISPTDKTSGSNSIDIGSVLIAFPELFYISD